MYKSIAKFEYNIERLIEPNNRFSPDFSKDKKKFN